ncbi:hypothetical protein N7456_005070 [Penicillium angulare]|uniref:Phosphatidylethanolamine-binding protein n=1 Tax=Penicillium angulare TaxID=116970 RepID=A0A9W9FYM9_9EURO|nr:hypothetical protein N7456_005070 [Penicillium angulare]
MLKYIEYGLSRLFINAKGRDARLFKTGTAFSKFPEPTITLECPEVGPSGSNLHKDHSADGAGIFPTLSWPAADSEVKQYLLVSEDPDAPLPSPIIHGIYYGIPATTTGVSGDDFAEGAEPMTLKGGFKYGKNRRGNIYIPCKPLLGHGAHRYFFTLVALREPIDTTKLSEVATIEEVAKAIEGKVVGWGEWVGVYERKWE